MENKSKKELKELKELKENKRVEIKVMPKIKDRFWKQKLSKTMANLFGSTVLDRPYRTSRRIEGVLVKDTEETSKKEICIFLDLARNTPFREISGCLEEIERNIEKEKFDCLKIQCFYWNNGVKTINLESCYSLKEKLELEYLETKKSHLEDFSLEANRNADLFIIITDKNNSNDFALLSASDLFYKNYKNKFIFCFVAQMLASNKLEIDWKIEKNSIVVHA